MIMNQGHWTFHRLIRMKTGWVNSLQKCYNLWNYIFFLDCIIYYLNGPPIIFALWGLINSAIIFIFILSLLINYYPYWSYSTPIIMWPLIMWPLIIWPLIILPPIIWAPIILPPIILPPIIWPLIIIFWFKSGEKGLPTEAPGRGYPWGQAARQVWDSVPTVWPFLETRETQVWSSETDWQVRCVDVKEAHVCSVLDQIYLATISSEVQ